MKLKCVNYGAFHYAPKTLNQMRKTRVYLQFTWI